LANIYIAWSLASGSVATVDAWSTDETIESLLNRFHGVNGFAKDPDLDHIARLPIVGWGGKAGCDDHSVLILVDDEAVHRRPPIDSMRATMAMMIAKPIMARGPWYLLGIFIWFSAHIQRAHAK